MSLTLEMPPSPPKKPRKILRNVFVLCFLLLFAFAVWLYLGLSESTMAYIAANTTPAVANMSSSVVQILVQPNALVEAGATLAQLDGAQYMQNYAAAASLVRGALPSLEAQDARVATAKAIEERIVQRVALARHEENTQRLLVERYSIEHARALLQVRDIDARAQSPGSATLRAAAVKVEQLALQNMQSAKAAFTLASRSRSTIEAELMRMRDELAKARSNSAAAPVGTAEETTDPTRVFAPVAGRIVGSFPKVGDVVQKGTPLFYLMPKDVANLTVIVTLTPEQRTNITIGTRCFVRAQHGGEMFAGRVESIQPDKTTATVHISLPPNVHAPVDQTPAHVIFWTHSFADLPYQDELLEVLSRWL